MVPGCSAVADGVGMKTVKTIETKPASSATCPMSRQGAMVAVGAGDCWSDAVETAESE